MSGDGRAPVAIIGAGVAGLSCAASIANAVERDGPVVELIDQGSRGRGGRASSSRPTTHDPPLVFDHGCQFFTAESEAFRETCAALERAGHIARWGGRFGTLDASTGVFRAKSENDAKIGDDFFRLLAAKDVYVGVPTMRGLCDGLRELIPENAAVDSPQCAVTRLERARDEDADENATPWVVSGVGGRALDELESGSRERALGAFRAVVATDVMLAKSGTPGSCAFEGVAGVSDEEAPPRPEEVSGASARAAATWRVMRSAPAESLFSLMVAFGGPAAEEDASVPFDAAVVTGCGTIQLLVRDSAKPGRGTNTRTTRNRWTAVSTAAFAARVVADAPLSVDGAYNPQTAAYLERVTPAMVEATSDLLSRAAANERMGASASNEKGISDCSDRSDAPTPTDALLYRVPPRHARSQRWGHAFPKRGWGGAAFAWDPALGFGACGDFAAGPGVEAAWTSGAQAGAAVARTMRGEVGG
jgi:hypothetical protein